MKGRKTKRRPDQSPKQEALSKTDRPLLLKIHFNTCKDNIACFIGERRNHKKSKNRISSAVKNRKASSHKPVVPATKPVAPQKAIQAKPVCEDIVNDSLNLILTEIQARGIDCPWQETPQEPRAGEDEEEDSSHEGSKIWSVFSVNDSFEKSYASTMDYYPPLPFYKTETLNPNSYCYNYPVTDNFNPNFGQSFESLNTFTRPFNDNQGDANRGYYEPQTFVVRPADIGRDPRTTIMIRNIPNKYTIRELAEEIDEELNNTYDFLYLPCDIKNQCNVGYGFINFLTTQYLQRFYELFHNHRWAKFRSEKICVLSYARLQGLGNLIEHFAHSKVLNQKDKKYRPIIRQYARIEHLIKTQQLS